jgi:hypothetical protein
VRSYEREIVVTGSQEAIKLELEVTVSVCDRVLSSVSSYELQERNSSGGSMRTERIGTSSTEE